MVDEWLEDWLDRNVWFYRVEPYLFWGSAAVTFLASMVLVCIFLVELFVPGATACAS